MTTAAVTPKGQIIEDMNLRIANARCGGVVISQGAVMPVLRAMQDCARRPPKAMRLIVSPMDESPRMSLVQ